MTTGERIRALRQAAKLSQEELGAKVGVQRPPSTNMRPDWWST